MAAFTTLPIEIQHMVLEVSDFATLRSLALVSKSMRPGANRFLYRELFWGPQGHITAWSCKTVQQLLRSLIEHPQLASLVKHVNLDLDYEYNFIEQDTHLEDWEPVDSDPQITELGRKLVDRLGLENPKSWYSRLKWTYMDNWIALLLAQLETMETLKLGPSLLHKSTKISAVFGRLIYPGSPHFRRLGHACFGENAQGFEMAGLDFGDAMVVSLFYLPSLQELDLTIDFPAVKYWDIKEPSHSLRTLRLWRCNIFTPDDVDRLLTVAPALETLHLGWNEDIEMFEDNDRFDFANLLPSLGRISNTLEDSTIDVR
ncbi:hypothetical protein BDV12DRAFT_202656 [Aspergillus spectabilis]